MMIPKNIENKEIGLLGLGVSGKSAFKSLKAGGGNIYAYDDNISNDPIVIEPDKWPWEKLNKIVVSPGISLNHPVIKKAESFKVDIINPVLLEYLFLKGCKSAIIHSSKQYLYLFGYFL